MNNVVEVYKKGHHWYTNFEIHQFLHNLEKNGLLECFKKEDAENIRNLLKQYSGKRLN